MFEQIINPFYKATLRVNPLIAEQTRARDRAILEAYERITMTLRGMLAKFYENEGKKYVEFCFPEETKDKPFIKEFTCHYCSLSLLFMDNEYILNYKIGKEGLHKGSGLNSNSLLRVAFKHTANENTQFSIEDALHIELINNTSALYKRKEDEYSTDKWNREQVTDKRK